VREAENCDPGGAVRKGTKRMGRPLSFALAWQAVTLTVQRREGNGMATMTEKTVGLVLGSGSSRGWAHIGVIEALEEAGIPVHLIAGCSVGAYVGAIFASGGLSSLKQFVLGMDGKRMFSYFDVVIPRSGLLDGNRKLREFLSGHTKAEAFEDLAVPLKMVATDLETGDKVVLKSGDLFTALRATMAFPGLFAPVAVKGRWLVDGGLVDPVPVGVARAMGADVVIAVDLNSDLVSHQQAAAAAAGEVTDPPPEYRAAMVEKLSDHYASAESTFRDRIRSFLRSDDPTPDILETVSSAIGIMQERITRINLAVEPPDVLVQPRLGEMKMMDFDNVDKAIEEGYRGVMDNVEDLRRMLQGALRRSTGPVPGGGQKGQLG
jgi:NTE family protein